MFPHLSFLLLLPTLLSPLSSTLPVLDEPDPNLRYVWEKDGALERSVLTAPIVTPPTNTGDSQASLGTSTIAASAEVAKLPYGVEVEAKAKGIFIQGYQRRVWVGATNIDTVTLTGSVNAVAQCNSFNTASYGSGTAELSIRRATSSDKMEWDSYSQFPPVKKTVSRKGQDTPAFLEDPASVSETIQFDTATTNNSRPYARIEVTVNAVAKGKRMAGSTGISEGSGAVSLTLSDVQSPPTQPPGGPGAGL